MLQDLRDYFPKWLIASVVGVLGLLVVGAGFYTPYSREYKEAQTVLVKVNRAKIRKIHLASALEALKRQQQQMGGSLSNAPDVENQWQVDILQQLVIMEVLKQRVHNQSYQGHLDTILALIEQIPAFRVNNQFSSQRFKTVLAAMGHTRASFFKEVADSQAVSQFSNAIKQSAFLIPKELQQVVRIEHQKRDFNYLIYKAQDFMPSDSQVSPEAVRTYYDQHLTDFRIPEKISLDYIILDRNDRSHQLKEGTLDDKEALEQQANQRFSENIERLTQLNKKHPRALTEIAKALNTTVQSTTLFEQSGGTTDITKHPGVIAIAFSQKIREGYNSAPMQLDPDRVIILRLKQHQPVRLPTFDEVLHTVRQKVCKQKAQQAAQEQGEQLIEKIKRNPQGALNLSDGRQWHKIDKATRDTKKVPPFILLNAFMISPQNPESRVRGTVLPNGDYMVIYLTRVRYGKLGQLEGEQKEQYRQGLIGQNGELDYLQYVSSSIDRTNIVYSLS
jgi:peptidyl-prolyl cis-trans isomerase D